MRLSVRKKGNVNILEFSGTMRMGEGDRLLREKMTELLAAGESFFVFDMAGVPWMDTAGIAEIIVAHKHVVERKGVIKLIISKKVHDIFTITQLSRVFEIYGDVEEALGSFPK